MAIHSNILVMELHLQRLLRGTRQNSSRIISQPNAPSYTCVEIINYLFSARIIPQKYNHLLFPQRIMLTEALWDRILGGERPGPALAQTQVYKDVIL